MSPFDRLKGSTDPPLSHHGRSQSCHSIDPLQIENQPRYGFLTKRIRQQYLEQQVAQGVLPASVMDDESVTSLVASADPNDRLWWWQIFSLTGKEPIKNFVADFYDRVFADEAEWFRGVFTRLSDKKYHITTQHIMYIDCFGGGRLYFGAEDRLNVHHGQTEARTILTAEGAQRWTSHMRAALQTCQADLDAIDVRIRPAIAEFLLFFMNKYGERFGFSTTGLTFL